MTFRKSLLPDVGVLALVPDRWGDLWQPRQHVMTRLARYFQVVWVNPALGWRENAGLRADRSGPETMAPRPPGFTVYEPERWLPKLYRPAWLARKIFQLQLKRARHLLEGRGCKRIVLYIWRPQFSQALGLIPFDLSCYHIDDEYSFSPSELPLSETEAQLIESVDQMFIHSPALLEKKGSINPHTAFAPNGVDYHAYAEPIAPPADLAPIPHPRIGYTGHIKRQLDWPLLRHLAARHPEWSFVFVGPVAPHPEIQSAIRELSDRPNVYFLGSKSVRELPSYPQHFDVCLLPYQVDDYTKYIYPLKLHEYLAGGRPLVGAPIRSLEKFSELVAVPRTPEEWSAAIAAALSPEANTPERRAARQKTARTHDWDVLVERMAGTMAQRLGERLPASGQ